MGSWTHIIFCGTDIRVVGVWWGFFSLLHINNIYHWCQGQEAGEED